MSRTEFSQATKRAALKRSGGVCECGCEQPFTNRPKERPEYDHRIPDFLGGDNSLDNCVVMRKCCHATKTAKEDTPRFAKVRREEKRRYNLEAKRSTFPTGRNGKWKQKVGGKTVLRD